MTDMQLAHSLSLSTEDRLRELHRLNKIAFATAFGPTVRPARKRLLLYIQQPDETLDTFFARTAQARLAWTSSLMNSATS